MSPSAMDLLDSHEAWRLPSDLYSCWNVRGMYSPLQFVLRLRPDIHAALNQAPAGWSSVSQLTSEQVHAASTYLHETIHWWQHVGSSSGLFLSLLYPAQAHLNHRRLHEILRKAGPFKSIRDYNLKNGGSTGSNQSIDEDINVVLNNWHDIGFYRYFVTDPTHAPIFTSDKYFESQCHSYDVAIGAVLWLISSVVDPDLRSLPDPRTWETESRKLSEGKVEGFYYESPVRIPPVGARQIFEGQARINQLQFLFRGAVEPPALKELFEDGYLSDVYGEALAYYLVLTDSEQPATIYDPLIAAFLLICDIAINPSEGAVTYFAPLDRMLEQHDPGHRFVRLCGALKRCKAQVLPHCADYSASGYRNAVEVLCDTAGVSSPLGLAEAVQTWSQNLPGLQKLLQEDSTFDFEDTNLPVRVFVARFARFQLDKLEHPEVLCWPGYWGAGSHLSEDMAKIVLSLFDEHSALFLDKEDGDVYPRLWLGKKEAALQITFDRFYGWVTVYDLVRQWTVKSGDFEFDYGWLTSKYSHIEMRNWVSERFAHVFGVKPEDFRTISDA